MNDSIRKFKVVLKRSHTCVRSLVVRGPLVALLAFFVGGCNKADHATRPQQSLAKKAMLTSTEQDISDRPIQVLQAGYVSLKWQN